MAFFRQGITTKAARHEACPKDHEKSMPSPLKFDRTCDFDIMTCVRKRKVARGAIVHRLKSKQLKRNIGPPAVYNKLTNFVKFARVL